MTLSISLSPHIEAKLREKAAAVGQTLDVYASHVLEQVASAPTDEKGDQDTIDLLRTWNTEDATNDPGEIASRQAEWEEFAASINAHHSSNRKVYP